MKNSVLVSRVPAAGVRGIKTAVLVSRAPGPGAPPDHASIVDETMPAGGAGNWATGQPRESSRRKDDQTRPGPSAATIETSPPSGGLWSELPIHTDATMCGWFG